MDPCLQMLSLRLQMFLKGVKVPYEIFISGSLAATKFNLTSLLNQI